MAAEAVRNERGGIPSEREQGALGVDYEVEDVFAGAEPWEPIETKLVLGSFAAAFFFLVLFGILIHIYILK